jgi:hypothetical protein
MTSRIALAVLVLGSLIALQAWARTPAPAGAEVYIISPEDGATLTSPVTVRFGAKGIGVAPAGVNTANTGHHHLLIDTDAPPLDQAIPKDDNHRHFGGGQTEAKVELKPGKHTLQLLMGDDAHVPHDPALMSKKITITVQ